MRFLETLGANIVEGEFQLLDSLSAAVELAGAAISGGIGG